MGYDCNANIYTLTKSGVLIQSKSVGVRGYRFIEAEEIKEPILKQWIVMIDDYEETDLWECVEAIIKLKDFADYNEVTNVFDDYKMLKQLKEEFLKEEEALSLIGKDNINLFFDYFLDILKNEKEEKNSKEFYENFWKLVAKHILETEGDK